ncbi:MAG TPA: hypothetical protein VII38_17685 [Polyangia bacterium]|jgi:hypothetical protein
MAVPFVNVQVVPFVDAGTGGRPFVCQGPGRGFALIGLALRAGAWIDRVTPIFAELFSDGTLGPAVRGASFGGAGGFDIELRARPRYVVTGLQTRSGEFVDGVRLLQTRWDGELRIGDASWTAWGGSSVGGRERAPGIATPRGAAVVAGIAGRAGRFVDNLTILTAELAQATSAGGGPSEVME